MVEEAVAARSVVSLLFSVICLSISTNQPPTQPLNPTLNQPTNKTNPKNDSAAGLHIALSVRPGNKALDQLLAKDIPTVTSFDEVRIRWRVCFDVGLLVVGRLTCLL